MKDIPCLYLAIQVTRLLKAMKIAGELGSRAAKDNAPINVKLAINTYSLLNLVICKTLKMPKSSHGSDNEKMFSTRYNLVNMCPLID